MSSNIALKNSVLTHESTYFCASFAFKAITWQTKGLLIDPNQNEIVIVTQFILIKESKTLPWQIV